MQSSLQYNPALTGIRAIAAMLVIADHCRVPRFKGGFFGVDFFFVLSGFLITRLLVEEFEAHGRIDLLKFYLRRLLRLAPPLLFMLVVYMAIAPLAWPQVSLWSHMRDAGLTAFYLSDYAQAFWALPKMLLHTWSLSVEEHFYLVWPFAVLLLARIEPRWRLAGLFGIYLLATAWRIFEYEQMGWAAAYYRFDTRTSGLIFGALLAIYLPRMGRISEETANALGVFACTLFVPCLAMGFSHAPGALSWGLILVQIAVASLLVSASIEGSWVHSTLSWPPLVGIGVISYSLYLWHYPMAVYFREHLPWYLTFSVVLIIALAAALISYVTLERPLQRYRRGLSARRRKVDAATDNRGSLPAAAVARRVP